MLLYCLDAVAGLQCVNDIAMTKILETALVDADTGYDSLEVMVYRLVSQMPTELIGKDKP